MNDPAHRPRPDTETICAARACRNLASYAVIWNNPKIHTPEREKVWLACEQHRQSLADFVDRRGFLLRVDAL